MIKVTVVTEANNPAFLTFEGQDDVDKFIADVKRRVPTMGRYRGADNTPVYLRPSSVELVNPGTPFDA